MQQQTKHFDLEGFDPARFAVSAIMSRRALRPRADVCQLCDFMIARQGPLRQPIRSQRFFQSRTVTTNRRKYAQTSKTPSFQVRLTARQASTQAEPKPIRNTRGSPSQADLENTLANVQTSCTAILSPERVPSEREVLLALAKCNDLAEFLALDLPAAAPAPSVGAASALLSLDEAPAKQSPSPSPTGAIERTINRLSKAAFEVVKYPTVFISPPVLELYVKIQATLRRPESLPEVLHMYARKPAAQDGSPVRYVEQNPNKIANAVTIRTADQALQTAMDAKQLQAAMEIVESTYGTLAFRRSKFVRRGLIPAAGAVALPAAAYTLATQLAHLQTNMDSALATNVAFAGIMAYTLFTGTIGIVAITTANDQMDRVSWAPGIPLRERWIREEERHAIDKIAGAWGFRESWRRGEEEGADWDALREWIGGKGMILDRAELMEGME